MKVAFLLLLAANAAGAQQSKKVATLPYVQNSTTLTSPGILLTQSDPLVYTINNVPKSHGERVSVIALTAEETAQAKSLDARQTALTLEKSVFEAVIQDKYLYTHTSKGTQFIHGWIWDKFKYSFDWKYIVPDLAY